MMRARGRARAREPRPRSPVPAPSLTVHAEQHCLAARDIEGHRGVALRRGPARRGLRPAAAVPLPGVAEDLAADRASLTPEQDHAAADRVISHRVREPRDGGAPAAPYTPSGAVPAVHG